MIKNKTLLVLFRLAVGGLFIYAGVVKIGDPLAFAQNIMDYKILSRDLSFWLALVLPWIEIFCGLLLAAGIWLRTASLLVSGLLAGFIVLVFVTILRGIDVDCGCFGAISRKADFRLIAEDALMLFMALNVFFSKKTKSP